MELYVLSGCRVYGNFGPVASFVLETNVRDSVLLDKSVVGYFSHFFTCRLNSETDFHPCL